MKAQLTAVILALHPDIRPEKRTSRTLNEAIDAYIDGDGKKLRRLRKDVADGTVDDLPLGGLIDEEKRLRDLIRALEAENGAVQIRAPFTMRANVEEEEANRAWREQLEGELESHRRRLAEEEVALANLLKLARRLENKRP